jgi:GAF domain-containing protein
MISCYRQDVRPFSERQIALLENFAAQAVIAMENARLITETHEALEQQTATAEVLQVINTSPGNLAPVFQTMLERGVQLCDARFGLLGLYDGDGFRGVATVGLPPQAAEALSRLRHPPPGTTLHHVQMTHQSAHEADISVEPAFFPVLTANPSLRSARTKLAVPLLKDGELVGAISVFREVVRPFSDKQISLLQSFAAQAVIAMENARLLTETREAPEQQTATAEVLQVINSSPGDLTPVFDAMLQRATRLCGTSIGSFYSYNGEAFRVLASTIGDAGRTIQPRPGIALWRIAHGESVVQIADIETEPASIAPCSRPSRTLRAGFAGGLRPSLTPLVVGPFGSGRPRRARFMRHAQLLA